MAAFEYRQAEELRKTLAKWNVQYLFGSSGFGVGLDRHWVDLPRL
jgi:hypothetical protein